MEVLWLFIIIFGGSYLFVYIIDTLRGKSRLARKINNKNMIESINKKNNSGEELSYEEKVFYYQKEQETKVFADLLLRGTIITNSIGKTNYFLPDVSEVDNKMNKLIWFFAENEGFNYLLVRGTKTKSNLESDDILILFHLFNKVINDKKIDYKAMTNLDYFIRQVKSAVKWSGDKKSSLLFNYKPKDEVYNIFKNFKLSVIDYKNNLDESTYQNMVNWFKKLYDNL